MSGSPEYAAALLERIGRLVSVESHAEGLLPVHWEVLRYLQRANRFSRTPAALTAFLGSTKGTVSQTVSALEARGLVRKQTDPKDRRSKRLNVTAKGKRLLARDPLALLSDELASMPQAQRGELEGSLRDLLIARLEARGRQPFGQCRGCKFFAADSHGGAPHYCTLLEERLTADDADAICAEQQPAHR